LTTPEDPTENTADSAGGSGSEVALADAGLAPETRPPHPTLPTPRPYSEFGHEAETDTESDSVVEDGTDQDYEDGPVRSRGRTRPDEYARRVLTAARTRTVETVRHPTPGMLFSLCYILIAGYVCHLLLRNPRGGILRDNGYDQQYFEWQLQWVQHAIFTGQNPLFSHAMNAPDGLNVMANPQILGPAFVLVPVTALLGPAFSFMVVTLANLALTAITWRWFLRRNVVRSQWAAFVGGLFLGFGPSMMTHSLAHPDLTAQYLVPLIVDRVLRLRTPGRAVHDGAVLGVLIAAQVFVGEEILFLAALAVGFYVIAYALQSPRVAKSVALDFLRGSGVAVLTAGTLLAYPLSFQFLGPMSFKGIPFAVDYYSTDLKSFTLFPSLTAWGHDPGHVDPLVPGSTEQGALFGWPLLILLAVFALLYIRSVVVRSMLLAAVPVLLLAMGPTPRFDKKPLPSPFGPFGVWHALQKLPLFSSSLPIRSALALGWLVGVLLAIGIDRAVFSRHNMLRGVAFGLTFCALVPLTPSVLRVEKRAQVPAFFTDGAWKSCLPLGHTIVGLPLSGGGDRTNMVWSVAAGDGFDIPQGPVMAPNSATDKQVAWARTNVLWTAQWLSYINDNGGGATPPITQEIKNQVAGDLQKWHAGCVVVQDTNYHLQDLKSFLDGTVGPGNEEGGVFVWRVQH
jgi:hypothetical protein